MPSGLFMGLSSTIIYTSELILCSTICMNSFFYSLGLSIGVDVNQSVFLGLFALNRCLKNSYLTPLKNSDLRVYQIQFKNPMSPESKRSEEGYGDKNVGRA